MKEYAVPDWHDALDPARSAVVEACAGSGKTWLIASRMVRALLAGTAPGEILAITFTRKAAGEMRERVSLWLAQLALEMSDDEALAFLVERGLDSSAARAALPRARGLHEAWVSAQPPAIIDTFHGWFAHLVGLQPLKAAWDGDAPFGQVLDDNAGRAVRAAWQRLAARCAREPASPVALAFEQLLGELGLSSTRDLLFRFAAQRAEWWAYAAGQADPARYASAELGRTLAVDPERDSTSEWLTDWRERLGRYAQVLARKGKALTKTDKQYLAALEQGLADGVSAFKEVTGIFVTKEGGRRLLKDSRTLRDALGDETDALLSEHAAIADSILALQAQLANQRLLALGAATYRCGDALIGELQALKAARGTMDHTDVETRAARLLADDATAAYLHARLDARYRQVLLDEFQDTNPQQWRALSGWLQAYGDSADAPAVFMVGDPRQAIYRFRRADPRVFAAAARELCQARGALKVERDHTQRNAGPIVEVINAVFAAAGEGNHFRPQTTARASVPGMVECLPLISSARPEVDAKAGPRDPLAVPAPEDGDGRSLEEGRAIAARLRQLIGSVQVIDEAGRPRPAGFGDVMILVRSRTPMAAYEQALREAGIPFLTARLGGLLDAIEVKDMEALMRFLVRSGDDLALAHVLRSPLFGLGDDALVALAECRESTWWQRLCAFDARPDSPLFLARHLLSGWLALADRLPVHDLLDRIYHEGDVLDRYRAAAPPHLGTRATANLHALIELALDLDAGRYPSLTRFIGEIARWRREDATDAPDEGVAAADGAVRIMTIHGAKGLEAPIVWLADAHRVSVRASTYRMLIDWPPADRRPRHFSPVFNAELTGSGRESIFEEEAREDAVENLNLLYVAMTRARQVLLVSGIEPGRGDNDVSWYRRIEAALAAMGAGPFGALPAAWSPEASAVPAAAPRVDAPLTRISIGERLAPESEEIRRGKLRHWVLQRVSEGSALEEPPMLGRRFGLPPGAAREALAKAHTTLAAPALRRFFSTEANAVARNEAEVVGADGRTRRVDRIVAFADEVWVLDYKSRLGPDVLPGYEAQVRDYVALVSAVVAPRRVRGALIDLTVDALFEVE
ncbi:MAG: UvrD-helicase domain-containing protein [Burkholderiales bacterium]|nr:UvrD-helicase domain-containing protein [Burkholderiales bacterium]